MRTRSGAALVAAIFTCSGGAGLGAHLALAQTPADAASASASASASETATATASAPDTHELPPEEPKVLKKPKVVVPLSIMGGLRIGAIVPAGDVGQAPQPSISVDPGADLTLEVGATIYGHFYGGLLFGGSFFISPANSSKSVSALLFGTEGGYLTNPKGFGAFFGLGIGYRRLFFSDALGNANSVDGPDLLVTVALHLRAGSAVRLLPRFDFAVGPAGGYTHALFLFGLSMWLNQDVFQAKP